MSRLDFRSRRRAARRPRSPWFYETRHVFCLCLASAAALFLVALALLLAGLPVRSLPASGSEISMSWSASVLARDSEPQSASPSVAPGSSQLYALGPVSASLDPSTATVQEMIQEQTQTLTFGLAAICFLLAAMFFGPRR